ncbi:MAG: type II toxin-antitoxin system VapC family toxin [Acetobacteraceae bacterium]
MKLLLDTHLLLWAALQPARLSPVACSLLSDLSNDLLFSSASIWQVTIKHGHGRDDVRVDPRLLRRGLLDNGYGELPITGLHALAVGGLPALHNDPFDRILVAQAMVEGITLLTPDPLVGQYPAPVRLVPAARSPPA